MAARRGTSARRGRAQQPRALEVVLEGEHVATLQRTRAGALRLDYVDSADLEGTPISRALPRGLAAAGPSVERFVAGLIPENDDALSALGRRLGIDHTDPMQVLAAIGKDCPGAIQFCPADELEATLNRQGSLEPMSDSDIEARLSQMSVDESASWTMPGEHWSLGGTQQKFALRREGGRWFAAHGAEPTSHIVKPGVRGMKAQALVEHVTMHAAALIGVPTARTEFASFKSESGLVVERFDRRREGGRLVRLHQEDLAQALDAEQKYEHAGGPAAADIMRLVTQQARSSETADANAAALVDMLVFNTVVAAPDAHARNYAILLDGDSVTLAPMFDAASGLPYDSHSDRVLAMSIGGERRAEMVTAEHWRREADALEVGDEYLLERVRAIASQAPDAFAQALDEVADADDQVQQVRQRLMGPLQELCATFASQAAAASTALHVPSAAPEGAPPGSDGYVRPHLRQGRPVRGHRRRRT